MPKKSGERLEMTFPSATQPSQLIILQVPVFCVWLPVVCQFIYSFGSALSPFLASIYLIFIIASLGLRQQFLNATVDTISAMAKAFRQPPNGQISHVSVLKRHSNSFNR